MVLRATGLIQRHQAACLDHNCTLQQERPLLQPPGSVATMSICYAVTVQFNWTVSNW